MVQTNKVLTVSYGTFSCTLEGFDDSFGTMKAIAEYFRDLASDDRYFGAEPPQPDADMLARIAQREISRRVEAHSDASGIVLRAGTTPAPALSPAPETAAPVEASEPDMVNDAAEVVPAEAEIEAEIAPAVDPLPEVVEDTAPVAEEVVAEADVAEEDVTEADDIAAFMAQQPDVADHIEADDVEEDAPAEIMATNIAPAADSIAAKLQRIRAVVSRNEAEEAEVDYVEDQHADAFLTDAADDISQALAAGDDDLADLIGDDDDDSIARVLASYDDQPGEDIADFAEIDEEEDDDSGEDSLFAGLDAALDDLNLDTEAEAIPAPAVETAVAEEDAEPAPAGIADLDLAGMVKADTAETPAPDASTRARVVKVKRADLEAAIAQGALEEIDDEDAEDADADTGSLSPEEEADLMRELAEVEAELSEDEDDDLDGDNLFDEVEDAPALRMREADRLEDIDDAADMSRLMDEAGTKMDDPENASNRETYAQLRAAVAATQAEKSVTGEMPQDAQDDAYRNDLASVVRPRRPAAQGSDSPRRPSGDRPAPLKLVAEQRVDDAAGDTPRGPVRPRRVSPADMEQAHQSESNDSNGGFVAFAQETGAEGLSELLEAAGAYMSFVEGREQFSRPQLMTKVRQVVQEEFDREDGLRAFGQLLREGKIRKTKGGRFTASDKIGFKPAQRAAG